MTACVAPNNPNTLQPIRLWMCRLTFDPPVREVEKKESDRAEEDPKTIFDKYMEGMHVRPLQEAYVLLLPSSCGMQSAAPDASGLIFCRTAKDGELLKITEGQISSAVPASGPSTQVSFTADSDYAYYWTLNRQRFQYVVRDVRANFSKATSIHDFASFRVSREPLLAALEAEVDRPFELLGARDDSWLVSAMLSHALLSPPSLAGAAGYCRGYDLKRLSATWNSGVNPMFHYVFARRRVADALYCGEISQCHAVSLRQRSTKEFALFSQVRDICAKVAEGERSPELDEMAEHQENREIYLQYAYDCAMQRELDRKLFAQALRINVNNDAWKEAAVEIANKYEIVHPGIDLSQDPPRWKYLFISQPAAMRYFDFYRFGITTHVLRTVQAADASEMRIERLLKQLRAQIAGLLQSIRYYEVLVCLGAYNDEETLDKKIHARYLDLSMDVLSPWWKSFEPENKSQWEQAKPYVENLGSFADKFFGTYSEHFDNFEHIEKYNALLENKAEHAEALVHKMASWNQLLKGKTVQLQDPVSSMHVSADLQNGIITIGDDSKHVLKMHLVVEEGTGAPIIRNFKTVSRSGRVRWHKVKIPAPFELKVEPRLKAVKNWPGWLSVFGQVLSITVSISEFVEKLKKKEASGGERVIAFAKVAKDTFQIIDGFSAALHASFPFAKDTGMVVKFAKIGEKFKGPGLVLEAVLNIQEGATILILDEDSLSASAVRRDDIVEGWCHESKGLILVASAVPGAVAAGSAVVAGGSASVAMAAAIPPLGIALAVAGVLVVGINVYLYVRHGPSNIMDDIDKALDKAKVHEFGDFFDKDRTADSLVKFSKTVVKLTAANQTASAW